MKKLYYASVAALIVFEALNVYFIMPFPGSQRVNSLGAAYFLYEWRWTFRIALGSLILLATVSLFGQSKRHLLGLIPLIVAVYFFNFRFAAERMFLEPNRVVLKNAAENAVDPNRQIVGVVERGEARAYPIQFLAYHHKLQDVIAGKSVLVTYCTVCRSGRVFEPTAGGGSTTFRLVGMDKFNAMIEDAATGSWWRQANGEAVAGKLKGQKLPEVESTQTTLARWLELYPNSLVMQPDRDFIEKYASYAEYEDGRGGDLTGRNDASWADKSWVVGIVAGESAKAFDWNRLQTERIINDEVAGTYIVLVLASDDKSFFAFERPSKQANFTLSDNQLISGQDVYDLKGESLNRSDKTLKRINAYQEFWHSWRTFHPNTEK